MSISVRVITPGDAAEIVRMWREFSRYLGNLGDTDQQNFGTELYLRDGFGPDPAFFGLIAESGTKAVGYLLYHFGYDVDLATRVIHVVDLWVNPAARRAGIGRKLMEAAAERGQAKGASQMVWSVFAPNRLAATFYEWLGASFYEEMRFMHMPVANLIGGI
ncbi:MAG: GNAT family N-acetyltransferase [Dongiaceae bacterium]